MVSTKNTSTAIIVDVKFFLQHLLPFYDKIYAKSNAAEVLRNELRSWRSETIEPVMVSSATDPYQPAELRYGLTRKCIEILQELPTK